MVFLDCLDYPLHAPRGDWEWNLWPGPRLTEGSVEVVRKWWCVLKTSSVPALLVFLAAKRRLPLGDAMHDLAWQELLLAGGRTAHVAACMSSQVRRMEHLHASLFAVCSCCSDAAGTSAQDAAFCTSCTANLAASIAHPGP